MPHYHYSSHNPGNWTSQWVAIAKQSLSDGGWRTTEVMDVPDGVIMMTTVVIPTASTAINTMFIPGVKVKDGNLVPK